MLNLKFIFSFIIISIQCFFYKKMLFFNTVNCKLFFFEYNFRINTIYVLKKDVFFVKKQLSFFTFVAIVCFKT